MQTKITAYNSRRVDFDRHVFSHLNGIGERNHYSASIDAGSVRIPILSLQFRSNDRARVAQYPFAFSQSGVQAHGY